jgi:fructosamine-3-kinase
MEDTDRQRVERVCGAAVSKVQSLDGGMIGTVERVQFADGSSVVVKTGATPLSVEARMLRYLSEKGLPVPDVYEAADDILILEYIDGRSEITPSVEREAADYLASLHDTAPEQKHAFGFPFDTLTGPVDQPNSWLTDWPQFYAEYRIQHVLDLCGSDGRIDPGLATRIDRICASIEEHVTVDHESGLIHGDVWQNNLLTDGDSILTFLDPACYYADPEIELAYVDWTETFGSPFFERYDEHRGIDPEFFEHRRFIYRLYPLLVHLSLFGSPYDEQLAQTVDRVDC